MEAEKQKSKNRPTWGYFKDGTSQLYDDVKQVPKDAYDCPTKAKEAAEAEAEEAAKKKAKAPTPAE